ncbi:hypothetical protein KKB43_00920 [Patescibacteria group bacterium]|nr:hypothetical protein [Patescibacteria group bacterium]MBU4579561.1 hypothetical protein [Patescibacteria group bacterium]
MFEKEIDSEANFNDMSANIERNSRFAEDVQIKKTEEETRLEKLALDKKEAIERGDMETVEALSAAFAKEVVRKRIKEINELTRKK